MNGEKNEHVSRPDVVEHLERLVATVRGFLHTQHEINQALEELQKLIEKLTYVEGVVVIKGLSDGVWLGRIDSDVKATVLKIRMYVLQRWCEDPWYAEREISRIVDKLREMRELDERVRSRVERLLEVLRSTLK